MADRRRVLFRQAGARRFLVIDSATRETRRVDAAVRELVLSPNNRVAFMVVEDVTSDIWMLELSAR